MSDATQEYKPINLYGCDDCERFYVLDVEPYEDPSCPSGHSPTIATSSSKYADYTICVTPDCQHFMRMNKSFPKGKCEGGCNKPGEKVSAQVDDSGVIEDGSVLAAYVVEAEEEKSTGPAAGLARTLKAEVDRAEGFKTSHHDNKSGRHTASASATHDRGDKENANIRKKKAAVIEAVLRKLQEAKDFDEQDHKDLVKRSEEYIRKYR